MELIIERGLVDLSNHDTLCHKTVINYCKDRYNKLGLNCKLPDDVPESKFGDILWNGINDQVTRDNIPSVLSPGYIVGFFSEKTGLCQHSMVVWDCYDWVGTNNFTTFLCDDIKAVGFFRIDLYTEKSDNRTVIEEDKTTPISNIHCGSHWSDDGQFWIKDSKGNVEKYIIKYRDIIKNPIKYCSICQYK